MKHLKDPNNTRIFRDLPLPIQVPPQSQAIFKSGGYIDWIFLKRLLQNQGIISEKDFQRLIKISTRIFRSEPNLIHLRDPVTIVGDIHGQFYDFTKIIQNKVGGCPDVTKYIFLGDYVDRGYFSVEVLILILALKISHSNSLIMLRGNHECRQLTSQFNFRQECLKKYSQNIYNLIMELFDALPIACLVNGKFLCVHGGISHQIKNLQDIQRLNRFIQIPRSGIFCDLMWSDPIDPNYYSQGNFHSLVIPNKVRHCSYFFGYELSKKFLQHNKLLSIIRAHEAQAEGYKLYKWKYNQKFPSVVTIFSAPNYCDYYGNKGAIINLVNNTLNIKQYAQSSHPCVLPKFLDLFSWSLPFIFQKVTQIFYYLIQPQNNIKFDEQLSLLLLDKKKIVEMILDESKKSTKENISLVKLKGNCPDQKLLSTGKYTQTSDQSFQNKKLIDIQNQSRPF